MKKYLFLLLFVAVPLKAEIYNIGDLDLKTQHGKVVYLDFWASWCKPCRESFPWMNGLVNKYPAKDFTVITINLDSDTAAMHRFLDQFPANFDVYHDPGGRLAEQFRIEGMPTSYLISPSGEVVKRHIGFYSKQTGRYEREIEELL